MRIQRCPSIASLLFALTILGPRTRGADAPQTRPATAPAVVVFGRGEHGYHTFRIPAIIAAKSGALLALAEGRKDGQGDAGDIDLVLRRSFDNGQTWGPLQVVADLGTDTIGNPCPVVDQASGAVVLLLTRNAGRDTEAAINAGTAKGTRTVWVMRSVDDGKTWDAPREITTEAKAPEWTWYATGPGVGIQLQSGPHRGRLVIPCDHKVGKADADFKAHVIYSDDAGQTWRRSKAIGDGTNECQVAERRDGTLLINMRNYAKGANARRRAIATSADGGATWGEVTYDAALIEPICQAGLIRVDDPKSPGRKRMAFTNPADAKARKRMTLRVSEDDGQTWPTARVLFEGPSAYSCPVALPDGVVGCLYERGMRNPYETIVFERVPLTEVK